jgi:inosose dehydratase
VKFAVNPLQFAASPSGRLDPTIAPPYDVVLRSVSEAGFDAIQSELAADGGAASYRASLNSFGIAPAPGYFAGGLEEPSERHAVMERFRQAAAFSRELGLEDIVVACRVTDERRLVAGRAQDAEPDEKVLLAVAATLNALGAIGRDEGVRVCFHPHVGTLVESAREIEVVLGSTDPSLVFLCPDTGHLRWGGIEDVPSFLRNHRGRIGMMHLKDLDTAVLEEGLRQGWRYEEFVVRKLWREPGLGSLSLAQIMVDLGSLRSWCVVEVDAPFLSSPERSLAACWTFISTWKE